MDFNTLKKYHLCLIEITLKSGEMHQGMITSHFYKEGSDDEIEQISLMQEWAILRINCRDIVEIKIV